MQTNLWWTSYSGRIRKAWIDVIKGIPFPFGIAFVLQTLVTLPCQTHEQTNRPFVSGGWQGRNGNCMNKFLQVVPD